MKKNNYKYLGIMVLIVALPFSYKPSRNYIGLNPIILIELLFSYQSTSPQEPSSNIINMIKGNRDKASYLIAHAGGAIDGHIYTNSLEAVELSIKNEVKYIELDLKETTDGKVVAVHNWGQFKDFIDYKNTEQSPLSYDEMVNSKMLNKYTPLSMDKINLIFKNNPNIYLVTDKIKNLELLASNFNYTDRMIVEIFSVRKYNEAIKLGLNNLALKVNINHSGLTSWLKLNKIAAVTYRGDNLHKKGKAYRNALALSNAGIVSLIYSSKDIEPMFIENELKIKNFALYSNYITPLSLEY